MTDYYAVLQVHPDAEQEVIDAAYRQLMRKYHPDVAGGTGARADALHERAKLINQAYAVLGQRDQRWEYDHSRVNRVTASVAAEPRVEQRSTSTSTTATTAATVAAPAPRIVTHEPAPLWGPLHALAAAYYLLPGPYEWEPGSGRELFTALLIFPVGIATWLVLTGRLHAPLDQLSLGVLAVCVGLLVSVVARRDLPRVVLAAAPTVLQFSGALDGVLGPAHVPSWFAAGGFALVSVLGSARLYVFAVLPTVGACWALSQVL